MTNTTTLTRTPAHELARLIRERHVSSLEVVDAHLARIAEVNPRINAVVQFAADARERARACDDSVARGDAIGPLHGVPFTAKDWIETEGLICAAGYAERKDYAPKHDATVVARMRDAGAVLLGKTNVTQGAPVYERPNNPYALDRTPGNSSSGEAAIIAAGGSPLGLGSDSGGSLRWPAHCCGIATIKPTNGLVPNTGHFPRIIAMADPRTTIGPMARCVEDLALALPLIAGVDGRDASVVPMPLGDHRAVDVAALRIAWHTSMPGAEPSPDTCATVADAVRALVDAGASAQESRPPRLEESLPLSQAYWARPESGSMNRWEPFGRESTLSADEVERSLFEWDRFRRTMLLFMEDYDVIVCPVAATPAPTHDGWDLNDALYTLPHSLTGYPSVVVRCGTSPEGLPIGVQVVARPWHDHVALAVAATLEVALGGWQPPNL